MASGQGRRSLIEIHDRGLLLYHELPEYFNYDPASGIHRRGRHQGVGGGRKVGQKTDCSGKLAIIVGLL